MTVVDEIKSRLDIVDIVSETVKLRHAGKNYTGFCPFHANTRTPAFVVFPDSGTWRCFGQCNEGGDLIKFVMKKEGWDFPQALESLAQRAGVPLEKFTPENKAEEDQYERLRGLLEEAVTFYRHHLLNTPGGQTALAYLKKRGLQPTTIETFGLGYAPDAWEACLQYFKGKGYSSEELLQVGLVTERQGSEGVYDRFRNRILFPIRDARGKMAGFGARILNPDDVPKFLNSPQTVLFDKGHLLYGLDQARKAIRTQDQVVIVEGYLDAIALHQAGFNNAVSPMGTALTEDQLRLLKRFTRRMILALDADAAGEKATLRGLEIARQALDHSSEMVFDPRGLIRQEARLQADVRVTSLPPGMDPDEVVLRDPAEWQRIIEQAKPIVVHVMETLAAACNMDDPKAKSDIAAQVLPLIEDVPNSVEREDYRQRLARLLRIDEHALSPARSAPPTRQGRRPGGKQHGESTASPKPLPADPARRSRELEFHALRLFTRQPEALYLLDRSLQQAGLTPFAPEDFEHADYQLLAQLMEQSLEQDHMDANHYFQSNVPEPLLEIVNRLREPMPEGEPLTEKILEDLVRTILNLRAIRLNEGIEQLHNMQLDLQDQGEVSLKPYHEMVLQYAQTKARIDRALKTPVQLD